MASAVEDSARRSPLYRFHRLHDARFTESDGALVVERYGEDDGIDTLRRLAIVDLTTVPRTGFKGRGAVAWLTARGVPLPAAPNRAVVGAERMTVARLSREEHLLLAEPGAGEPVVRLAAAWSRDEAGGCYPLPRADSHCRLLVAGEAAAEMLAKLCAVDLRRHRFPTGHVAQTQVARIHAVVIAAARGTVPVFEVLADSASCLYLWDTLLDAGAEFDIRPLGIAALRAAGGPLIDGGEIP